MTTAIRSEFRKLLTLRYWWALGITPTALGLLAALVVSGSISSIVDEVSRNTHRSATELFATIFVTVTFFVALLWQMLFSGILGAVTGATETTTGSIVTTFLTSPTRDRVISAKALVTAVVAVGYFAGVALAALLSVVLYTSIDSDVSLSGKAMSEVVKVLAIGTLLSVLWSLYGLGLGMLIGSTTGAVTGLTVWYIIGELFVTGLLASAFDGESNLYGFFPVIGSFRVLYWCIDGTREASLPLVMLFVWLVVLLCAGWWRLRRRDVN